MNMASKFRTGVFIVLLTTATVKADPTLGLAAHWDFDEGSGTVLHDQSGNGNDGTIYGATWQDGVTGKSLFFDGVNDYVNIGDKFNNITVPYSITCWIKKGWSGSQNYIICSDNQYNYYGFRLWMEPSSNGNDRIRVGYGDGGYPATDSRRDKTATIGVLPTDAWVFISAVVRGPTNMSLYLDGTEIAGSYTGSGGGMVHSSGSARIGNAIWGDVSGWFKGSIDELRIYSRVLDSNDVQELYGLRNNNTVINIDATLYGDPGTGMNTLKVPFAEGYYVSEFVASSMDSRAFYTAWSAWSDGSPWYSAYGIKIGQRVFNNGSHIAYSSPEEAFAAADPKIIQFYVPQTMEIEFYIADNAVADNRGGVSLLIHKTSPADFDSNLVVDFMDFAMLAKAWLTFDGESSFNWRCDTTFDNAVEVNDLAVFTSDWLGGVAP